MDNPMRPTNYQPYLINLGKLLWAENSVGVVTGVVGVGRRSFGTEHERTMFIVWDD